MGLTFDYEFGQTLISEEEKDGLLIKTISTQKELNEWEQINISKAVEWSIGLLPSYDLLAEKFIKQLHKKMYGEVWRWAGYFRKTDKNIGVKWTQVPLELKMLLDDTRFWVDNKIYSEEEIAIRFKHRLVSIHCFPNGNGRHSRLMADIMMDKLFHAQVFSWQKTNLVYPNQIRKEYIQALKIADLGDIQPLLKFAKHK